jgi:Na+-transporting methylmalonyl-CoA/oxaloacetate decarboxylase gamma subunit
MGHILTQGIEVMLLGLAGVFLTLIVFYALIRIMLLFANRGKKKNAPDAKESAG